MDDVLHHMDAVGLMEIGRATSHKKPPALGIVLVGSEVVASHPRAWLEPSLLPRVETPNLAKEMRSSANADGRLHTISKPCQSRGRQFEVQRWNIAGSPEVMTDWAMSWAGSTCTITGAGAMYSLTGTAG